MFVPIEYSLIKQTNLMMEGVVGAYTLERSKEEYEKAISDEDFMKWLRGFEPDWKTAYWERNIVVMHNAFLAGRCLL